MVSALAGLRVAVANIAVQATRASAAERDKEYMTMLIMSPMVAILRWWSFVPLKTYAFRGKLPFRPEFDRLGNSVGLHMLVCSVTAIPPSRSELGSWRYGELWTASPKRDSGNSATWCDRRHNGRSIFIETARFSGPQTHGNRSAWGCTVKTITVAPNSWRVL